MLGRRFGSEALIILSAERCGIVVLAATLLLSGCSGATQHQHDAAKPTGLLIDEDRIARSGGATAW